MGKACQVTVCGLLLAAFGLSGIAAAKDEVGAMVALRGRAIIERDKKGAEARIKDGIFLTDAVSTMEKSRAKMLFIDDSILNMGEKSKVIIREFVYREKEGKSIFNLIDGKMRSVVGKTGFEVHTPTVVVAARGTVILFEAGVRDEKKFTTLICLEGNVDVRSADPNIAGTVTLTQGMMVTVFEKEALPAPSPAPAEEVERLNKETEVSFEPHIPGPAEIGALAQPSLQPSPPSPGEAGRPAGEILVSYEHPMNCWDRLWILIGNIEGMINGVLGLPPLLPPINQQPIIKLQQIKPPTLIRLQ